jgi:hypothetical protein
MRNFQFIILCLFVFNLNAQLELYKGVWVSKQMDVISIRDVNQSGDDENAIAKGAKEIKLNVILKGDVLSFQKRYYTAESNFTTSLVDSFEVKLISKNDKNIVVKPVGSASIRFFKTKKKITLTKQDYIRDTTVQFKKVVFKTPGCYGNCPKFELEINDKFELYQNGIFYNEFSMSEIDTNLTGQFSGQLNKDIKKRIDYLMQSCFLKTIKISEYLDLEQPVTSLIIYFNDEKRVFKFNQAPALLEEFVHFLTYIYQDVKLTKSNEVRDLEHN